MPSSIAVRFVVPLRLTAYAMLAPRFSLSGVFKQLVALNESVVRDARRVIVGNPVHTVAEPPGVIVYVGVFTPDVELSQCAIRKVTFEIVEPAGIAFAAGIGHAPVGENWLTVTVFVELVFSVATASTLSTILPLAYVAASKPFVAGFVIVAAGHAFGPTLGPPAPPRNP